MALLFDIETDGFDSTKIHCLVIKDTDTGKGNSFTFDLIPAGLRILMTADCIVGHNVIKFDIPQIQKLYPWFKIDESKVIDTLVLSRLIYSELSEIDAGLMEKGKLPGKLYRSHSLKAWGYRLDNHKDEYEGGWEVFTPEMLTYCVQDVETLHTLYDLLMKKNYSQEAIDLEHKVCWIIARQERHGFYLDQQAAAKLYSTLVAQKNRLEADLKVAFPPKELKNGKPFVPKRDNAKLGYTAGVPVQKYKLTEFNPSSRDHIGLWLKDKYNWKPTVFTNDGKPKLDESVLAELEYPEAKVLSEYLMVAKRLGQLAEGEQAWLKQVSKDGRLHGSVITNGAVTGRATHSNPNLAQVPSCSAPYGSECRTLFSVPKGKKLVGADLSGLELRCLAHFMAKWDKGAYGKVLLEGDIHTANQEAAGLETRNQAKTFIYAFLYGAGNQKIGSVVGKGAEAGAKLKKSFLKKIPALGSLVEAVQAAAEKGYLIGLDGRKLHVRSSHAALNTLLQSAGALIAKQALIEFDNLIKEKGWQDRVQQVAWVHDEIQVESDEEIAEEVGELAIASFQKAGEYFKFRIPITGEFRVGRNWAETH